MTKDINPPINLSKHFKKMGCKGSRITCKYCEDKIELLPVRGINNRRKQHLQRCEKYLAMTTEVTVSTRDYEEIVKSTGGYDDEPDKIMMILSFM